MTRTRERERERVPHGVREAVLDFMPAMIALEPRTCLFVVHSIPDIYAGAEGYLEAVACVHVGQENSDEFRKEGVELQGWPFS